MTDSTTAETEITQKPAGLKEFTVRSVICGFIVAAIMGASYPYVVLKLGFGPNVSVVAAFFGYLFLGVFSKTYNRWENNIVQTAGTAAAQTAFMCVLLAAFDMLADSKAVTFTLIPTPFQSFLWLSAAGILGVLMAVPLRQHFIVDEKLPFADGIAAGETLIVLDGRGKEAGRAAKALAIGAIASAAVMLMTEDAYVLKWFPSVMVLGTAATMAMGVGLNWSLLSLGSGMLVGLRINASMLLGTIASWIVAPYILMHYGVISEYKKTAVLFWVMWPATGMLVAGGLAALFLRWKVLAKTFKNLRSSSMGTGDFPLSWVVIGVAISGTALVVIQKISFGLEPWITIVAILLSVPLALVGLRVLGETNWGPISALSNMMQGIFGVLAPGHIAANMIASGTTGTIAIDSEAIMQDFKAGHMIGSTPKYLTYMQLLATPIGAAAVSYMYPLLKSTYGVVGENAGLTSPISRKWAGFAEVLSKGFEALPPGAATACLIGCILGIFLAVMETRVRNKNWIPSPTGIGIGMLVPAAVIIMMFLGSVVDVIWQKISPKSNGLYMTPLASGLIAGEAIIAVIIPFLVVLGFVHP